MSRLALRLAFAALGACSIPDGAFRASIDSGAADDDMTSVLGIRASTASIQVDEGATAELTVRLTQPPSGELIVRVAPADAASAAKLGLSLPELRFGPTSFDQAQTITVTGLADPDAADGVAAITLSADGLDPVTVGATVRDHDKVEIATSISATGILVVNEPGSSEVRVHLTHQPAGDVRVVAVLGAGPMTVTPAQRTFTADNYADDQKFTFSAPDDVNIVSEDQALTFQATGLPDKLYTLHEVDKDSLNIHVNLTSLSISEGGSTPLSVTLTKQPASSVTVHLAVQTGAVSLSRSDLVFTPANFDRAQDVTVTAPQDPNTVNDPDTVTLSIPALPEVDAVPVGVTSVDRDTQGIETDAPDPLPTTENQTAAFGVRLKFQPTGNVTLAVSSLDGNVATAAPGALTFTPANYGDLAQHQVTVRGAHDPNLATSSTSIKLHEASLADKLVRVSVADIDHQELIVTPTTLAVAEGATRSFSVSLKYDPGTGTTVTTAIDNDNVIAVPSAPGSLTFSGGATGTWAAPVAVTLSPPIDTNAMAETARITVRGTAAGATDVVVNATVSDPTVVAQYGFPPPAFSGSVTLSKGTVMAVRVPVPVTTRLDALAVNIPAGAGDFRMALYADAGGAPGALIAVMPQRQAIGAGPNVGNLLPDASDPTITVGTYWLAIRVAQSTAISQSATVTGPDCFTNVTIQSLDADWPNPFGAHVCQMDNLMNLWINTYHQ